MFSVFCCSSRHEVLYVTGDETRNMEGGTLFEIRVSLEMFSKNEFSTDIVESHIR